MPITGRLSRPIVGWTLTAAAWISCIHASFTRRCEDGDMSAHMSGVPASVEGTDTAMPASSPRAATPSLISARPRSSNGQFIRVVRADNPPVDPKALPEDRFLEREVSWLQFNERVLQLAADPSVPLLERTRYLAIFASNLDEFFMVRVAGLKRRIATGLAVRSASGLEPREVLEKISLFAHELTATHARVFDDQVRPALIGEGITIVRWDELDAGEQE